MAGGAIGGYTSLKYHRDVLGTINGVGATLIPAARYNKILYFCYKCQ